MNFHKAERKETDTPRKESFLKKRSFQYGGMATIFTILFIAAIVLVNLGVSWASNRFPISVDMTANKTYNLSSKTLDYIKGIHSKITVNVLSGESDFLNNTDYAPVAKLIAKYPQYNPDITVKYVDLAKNPTFTTAYPDASLSENGILVTSGKRYKALSIDDVVQTTADSSTGSTTVSGYDTEDQIDSALVYVTTTNLPTVDFTLGHNEQDSSGLTNLLKKNNYNVETKNISSEALNPKAQTLAIVDPKSDFSQDEIKKIDDFLTNGGSYGKNLVVFFDPSQSKLTNIESYVNEWGISVGTGVIYDTQNSINNDQFEPLSGDINSGVLASLPADQYGDLAYSRPLSLLFSTKGDLTTSSIVSTQSSSKLFDPAEGVASVKEFKASASDKSGPFTVAAKSTRSAVVNNVSVSGSVMVFGSYDIINSTLLSESNLMNSDILIDSFNNIGGFKSPITVNSKTVDSTALNISATQQRVIEILFIVIIPLAVLAAGLVIWLRRRHL